jgi:histidinol-phosphate aminotransferase
VDTVCDGRTAASPLPEQVIRPEIRALSAYHVPDSRGMVKLDAMENPYGLPAELQAEVAALVAGAPLNLYPDPAAPALKARLRRAMAIPDAAELVLGNGSDELIQVLALALARPGAGLLGVEPSFVMYRMIAAIAGMDYVGVPLRPDFTLDAEAVLEAIRRRRPALIFLAYPNNPTGNLFDAHDISRIIQAAPGLVVVDEAYYAFAGASFLPQLQCFPNLLVMRTVSKVGLAGLRLGLLAGASQWLEQLEKVRLPYNVSVLTQLVAEKVLQHDAVLHRQAEAIKAQRVELKRRLEALPGVEAFPSDANFILFRLARADQVFSGLKQRGVLIKNLSHAHAALEDCLRVTVGTPEQNEKFISALEQSIIA